MAYHISLERPLKVGNRPDLLACRWLVTYYWKALDKGYNFALDFTSIKGLHKELRASKVVRVSNLGVARQNDIWVQAPCPAIENTIRGRWQFPLSLGDGESCESMFAHGSSVHQKCSNYPLTNLLFGLCRSVWIIDSLVIRLNPHLKTPACPFTPEVIWTKERTPTPYPFDVFSFGLIVESIKEIGGASTRAIA